MKIWSLLPSATEMLFALGLGDEVTGVTHECDYPAEVNSKPRVTVSHIDSSRSGFEIDRQVTERFRDGLQLYGIDEERLKAEPPDLIITQDLCPVCAVSPSDFTEHMDATGCLAEVVTLNPTHFWDIVSDFLDVGMAAGRHMEAEDMVDRFQARVWQAQKAVDGTERRPRVLCVEWLDPPMPGGHWVPKMVEFAGGDNAPLTDGEPSRKVPWEEMRQLEPEIIVLMPCGFGPERAAREADGLWELKGWSGLPAVRKGHVYAVDGNAFFSRPGPRVVDGIETLAHIFHPDLFRTSPAPGSVLKLVPPPAGASSVENWSPRFEPF